MTIKWNERHGDYFSECGRYEIEQAGENSFWAFSNERPVGTYKTAQEAKNRCQNIDNDNG